MNYIYANINFQKEKIMLWTVLEFNSNQFTVNVNELTAY